MQESMKKVEVLESDNERRGRLYVRTMKSEKGEKLDKERKHCNISGGEM